MDLYTELTKAWLDRRYRDPHGHAPGTYFAHEPIYGIGAACSEPNHVRRIVRLFQLLRSVRDAGGASMLDVGGSEGYLAQLCRELFGMSAVSVDLSEEACRRAAELFGMPSCAVDAGVLPFATDSFDVVVCAEVVEHLAEPVPSILEMQRVARGTLVLSTEEWEESAEQRDAELAERKTSPHGDRSIFADVDIKPLFSPYKVTFERQVVLDKKRHGEDRSADLGALRKALLDLARAPRETLQGIVLLARKDGVARKTPKVPTDAQIVDHLLARKMPIHTIPASTPVVPWPTEFVRRCVLCSGVLGTDGDAVVCTCGERYPRVEGVISFQRTIRPFAARVDEMLRERGGPGYPEQKRDLLALAAKLELEFKVTSSWDFRKPDAAPWECNDQIERQLDGSYRSSGPDPWLESPLIGVAGSAGSKVVVEFGAKAANPKLPFCNAEVFWMEEGDAWFSAAKSVTVVVPYDGAIRKHVFVCPQPLRKRLVKLRFDPVSGDPATIVVRSISLT